MTIENRLYKASEAANLLGVSTKSIYNYIEAEQIKGFNRGGRWYIDGDEIKAFMERGLKKGYWKELDAKRKEG